MVLLTKVKADDPANLLIRTQFGNWPKERLAQIHSGETSGHGEFCGQYYRLQPGDRLFGRLFKRLRDPVFNATMAMARVSASQAERGKGWVSRWAGVAAKRSGDLLIGSGLWEIAFRVRLSPDMVAFIRRFDPDIVYCSGYTLGFATLPLLISRRFGTPICFQTLEDWPAYTYRNSPVGPLLRRQATRLIQRATLRLAFGEKMKSVYERRYGSAFRVTYHLDDSKRFLVAEPGGIGQAKRVVFTGNLVLQRHESIEDLLRAVRLLQQEGLRIEIEVYCPGLPKELSDECRSAPEIKFLPIPSHEELPRVLQAADVLFLPEAFSVGATRLGLALSTKCHLFMMAGRAILVYGPDYAGTIEYAREQGWALVVQQRDVGILANALRRLLTDGKLRAEVIARASDCFRRNHDLKSGRERFEQLVAASARRA